MSLVAASIVLLAAGCGPPADEGAEPGARGGASPPPAEPRPTETDVQEPAMTVEPGLKTLVDLAIADLAERVRADSADIAVISAESMVWPDASLGCPRPGMRYTQVPQDGALIVLELDGRTYRYHSGGPRAEPFLCEQKPEKTPPPTLDPSLGEQT